MLNVIWRDKRWLAPLCSESYAHPPDREGAQSHLAEVVIFFISKLYLI